MKKSNQLLIGKLTLVFEFYNVLAHFVDPRLDNFDLSDEDLKCFNIYPNS